MQTIFQKIDLNTYRQLVKVLGEEREYVLAKFQFEVNTDRNDNGLAKYILEKAQELQKIADILGCDASELNMEHDYEHSDHELASHALNLNNNLQIGSYCFFQDQLYVVENINFGVYHIKSLESGEQESTSSSYLSPAHWGQIFMLRDKMDVNEVY